MSIQKIRKHTTYMQYIGAFLESKTKQIWAVWTSRAYAHTTHIHIHMCAIVCIYIYIGKLYSPTQIKRPVLDISPLTSTCTLSLSVLFH